MCIRFSQFVHICCTLHINSLQGATYVNKLTKSNACKNSLCVCSQWNLVHSYGSSGFSAFTGSSLASRVLLWSRSGRIVEDTNSGRPLPFFFSKKKKKKVCVCVQIKLMLTNFALCRLVQIEDSCQQVGCCLLHFGNEKY